MKSLREILIEIRDWAYAEDLTGLNQPLEGFGPTGRVYRAFMDNPRVFLFVEGKYQGDTISQFSSLKLEDELRLSHGLRRPLRPTSASDFDRRLAALKEQRQLAAADFVAEREDAEDDEENEFFDSGAGGSATTSGAVAPTALSGRPIRGIADYDATVTPAAAAGTGAHSRPISVAKFKRSAASSGVRPPVSFLDLGGVAGASAATAKADQGGTGAGAPSALAGGKGTKTPGLSASRARVRRAVTFGEPRVVHELSGDSYTSDRPLPSNLEAERRRASAAAAAADAAGAVGRRSAPDKPAAPLLAHAGGGSSASAGGKGKVAANPAAVARPVVTVVPKPAAPIPEPSIYLYKSNTERFGEEMWDVPVKAVPEQPMLFYGKQKTPYNNMNQTCVAINKDEFDKLWLAGKITKDTKANPLELSALGDPILAEPSTDARPAPPTTAHRGGGGRSAPAPAPERGGRGRGGVGAPPAVARPVASVAPSAAATIPANPSDWLHVNHEYLEKGGEPRWDVPVLVTSNKEIIFFGTKRTPYAMGGWWVSINKDEFDKLWLAGKITKDTKANPLELSALGDPILAEPSTDARPAPPPATHRGGGGRAAPAPAPERGGRGRGVEGAPPAAAPVTAVAGGSASTIPNPGDFLPPQRDLHDGRILLGQWYFPVTKGSKITIGKQTRVNLTSYEIPLGSKKWYIKIDQNDWNQLSVAGLCTRLQPFANPVDYHLTQARGGAGHWNFPLSHLGGITSNQPIIFGDLTKTPYQWPPNSGQWYININLDEWKTLFGFGFCSSLPRLAGGGVAAVSSTAAIGSSGAAQVGAVLCFDRPEDPTGGFMSNFYLSPMQIDEITYPFSESYFQGRKSINPADLQAIAKITDPMTVRTKGREIGASSSYVGADAWQDGVAGQPPVQLEAMFIALQYKFVPGTDLAGKLTATGLNVLIEETGGRAQASSRDLFWGVIGNKGDNWLGILLMLVRANLNGESIDREFVKKIITQSRQAVAGLYQHPDNPSHILKDQEDLTTKIWSAYQKVFVATALPAMAPASVLPAGQ